MGMSRFLRWSLFAIVLAFINGNLAMGEEAIAQNRPVKEFTMVVQEKAISLMDDPKKAVTVWAYGLEGQEATVPGPVIRVQVGDLVRVHFKNTHTLPHTIHFHGTHPFVMDGNGQRALGKEQLQMPGETHTYEFVGADPGYFLYHCHFDTPNHLDHGMYGLFVVEDPAWPMVDRELVTFWDEWDADGNGEEDTHTINTRSYPDVNPIRLAVGERVRLILANIGYDVHTPHLHGHVWEVLDPGNLRRVLSTNPNGVLSVAPAEVKVVEFTTSSEGTWLFHCHVLPHVNDQQKYPRGMLTLVKVEESTGTRPPVSLEKPATPKPGDQVASLPPIPKDIPVGNVDRGRDLFNGKCKSCHGRLAAGDYGPKLAGSPILNDHDRFWGTVLNGRGGNMPPWKDQLSTGQIADILAWLQTLR